MKILGTKSFRGGSSTIKAEQWLQNLEKNFDATQCPEDYKKDAAENYLKNDARDWWTSVKKHYGHRNPTWTDFRREFEAKYFPSEARDRLETEFMNLEQGEKSIRELESNFTQLRRYVYQGREDEVVMVRRLMQALLADIRNRLRSVTDQRTDELVERAVNVEEILKREKKAMRQKPCEEQSKD
ncbi:PREDICTED: uncharacterized protein LOC104744053 [Camelina sativa]|uniref:Uncharacterized protein LOC104744053 n=1 Tax=Camelina sativa TaxID=90675 RepID=A0ABM0VZ16_CAMSA|nr:PREDICTED: uncharacterized protein LOC104744053 [Camelina sativa]